MLSNCHCIINATQTNSRGVAVLLRNNFEYEIICNKSDSEGNYLCIDLKITSFSARLINIYAANQDKPQFFENIYNLINENEQDYLIICGDFNLALDPELDTHNYINVNNPRSRQKFLDTMQLCNLKDVFRVLHPKLRRYSWRRKHPMKQARLDYFIVSEQCLDLVGNCKINPGYRSDHSHSIIEL